MFKKPHIIINPAAGREEPILSLLNNAFREKKIHWDVSITQGKNDATTLTTKALTKGADIIFSYGGDGTVMEVARALQNTNIPLAILPGGTANVMAKGLGIPTSTKEALDLFLSAKCRVRHMDMGMCNNEPFIVRITMGHFAHMTADTTRKLKDQFGQLAYGMSAVKHLGKIGSTVFNMHLDGKAIVETGSTLIITNTGNIGIPGVSILPTVSVNDGFFDIILFKDTNLTTLASAATSMFLKQKNNDQITYWRAKKISVSCKTKQAVNIDDEVMPLKNLTVSVVPKAVRVVVPIGSII